MESRSESAISQAGIETGKKLIALSHLFDPSVDTLTLEVKDQKRKRWLEKKCLTKSGRHDLTEALKYLHHLLEDLQYNLLAETDKLIEVCKTYAPEVTLIKVLENATAVCVVIPANSARLMRCQNAVYKLLKDSFNLPEETESTQEESEESLTNGEVARHTKSDKILELIENITGNYPLAAASLKTARHLDLILMTKARIRDSMIATKSVLEPIIFQQEIIQQLLLDLAKQKNVRLILTRLHHTYGAEFMISLQQSINRMLAEAVVEIGELNNRKPERHTLRSTSLLKFHEKNETVAGMRRELSVEGKLRHSQNEKLVRLSVQYSGDVSLLTVRDAELNHTIKALDQLHKLLKETLAVQAPEGQVYDGIDSPYNSHKVSSSPFKP